MGFKKKLPTYNIGNFQIDAAREFGCINQESFYSILTVFKAAFSLVFLNFPCRPVLFQTTNSGNVITPPEKNKLGSEK